MKPQLDYVYHHPELIDNPSSLWKQLEDFAALGFNKALNNFINQEKESIKRFQNIANVENEEYLRFLANLLKQLDAARSSIDTLPIREAYAVHQSIAKKGVNPNYLPLPTFEANTVLSNNITLRLNAFEGKIQKLHDNQERLRDARLSEERLAQVEKERLAQVEKERLVQVEKERLAQVEKERLAQVEKERLVQVEKERLAQVEKERLAQVEKERLAQEKYANTIAKHKLSFDTYLAELKLKTDELISKGNPKSPIYNSNYQEVAPKADALYTQLETAGKVFFNPENQPTSETFLTFINTCADAMKNARGSFENQRSLWGKIPTLFKAIIGLILSIPVGLPFLVLGYGAAYKDTFFRTPPTDSIKKLTTFYSKVTTLTDDIEKESPYLGGAS